MGRSNKNKNLPPYMTEARGWYLTRYPIPEETRPAFPKYAQRKQLITNDRIDRVPASGKPTSAHLIKHRQNIEAVEDVIRLWKSKSSPSLVEAKDVAALYTPDQIIDAIESWKRRRIDDNLKFGHERELKELNGIEVPLEDFAGRDLISHRLDAIWEMSRRVIKDQIKPVRGRHFVEFDPGCFSERGEFDAFSAIPDFYARFASALSSEGVRLLPDARILGRAFAVEAFASAWSSVLKSELFHRCGSELHRIENEVEIEQVQKGSDILPTENFDENNLESIFERYLKSKPRKDIKTKRRHWNALIKYFGNIDISKVKSPDLENFKIALSTSPKTRKSKYSGIDKSKLKQALISDGFDVRKLDYSHRLRRLFRYKSRYI